MFRTKLSDVDAPRNDDEAAFIIGEAIELLDDYQDVANARALLSLVQEYVAAGRPASGKRNVTHLSVISA